MAERRVADTEARRPARRDGTTAPGEPRHGPRTAKAAALATALLAGQTCLAATSPAAAETRPPEPPRRSLPKPEYPPESRHRGEEGDVRVALRIDQTGAVRHIDILESSGSPALDTAALVATASWRFRPATRDGEPVASTVSTVIRFRLRPPRNDASPRPGPGAPRRPNPA